jgi:pyruvate dehydrogenase E2 component (dihydrolipoyllysine-residue acetyltransferase)
MTDPATPISDRGLKGEITVIELDRQERTLARRSAESRATVPTVEYSTIVAVDCLLARELELGSGVAAAVVAASAHALRAMPRVNGSYRDGRCELYSRINVGVTLVGDGLYVTPTIFDADGKSAVEIGDELGAYHARAREGELHASELGGATFTVVDSSEYDIVAVTPLILPPQAGALAFGPVRKVPVLRDGQVVPGCTMQLSLAVDHRIVYGHHAAAFLEEVKSFLEEARI